MKTKNIQHPTFNAQHPSKARMNELWMLDVRCWMLNVFLLASMGAIVSPAWAAGAGAATPSAAQTEAQPAALHVGAAAAEFEADDTMVIAGGITPGKASGQEGKLRAVAVVLEQRPSGKIAIVACDVLMVTRAH